MIRRRYPDDFTGGEAMSGCVIALGFFDGVHVAHRHLLGRAKDLAKSMELPLAAFTFSSEGTALKSGAPRIYPTEEKLCLLEECGVDLAIVADFGAVRGMDKNDFITELLVGKFNCRAAVCGFNYRFGSGALGDSEYLTAVLAPHGIPTLCVDEVSYGGTAVSSTIIRHALSEARISDAAALLGKPYYIKGVVGRGLGLGGTWGIPTVNTALPECGILLPSGVYETAVYAGGTLYPALTNVGVCPTVSERAPHAETYIIDYSGDLYGEDVKIYFVEFIREEIRFPDKDSLIERIKADIESVSKGEPKKKWQTIGLN